MHRHIPVALLAVALFACATGASASDSLRVGNCLLMVGDSAATVTELLGKPSHKSRNRGATTSGHRGKRARPASAGAKQDGEQWQYRHEGRVIVVTLVDGRVSDIDERSS